MQLFFAAVKFPFLIDATAVLSWIQLLFLIFTIITAIPITLFVKNRMINNLLKIQTLIPLLLGIIATAIFIWFTGSALANAPQEYREYEAIQCLRNLFSPLLLGIVLSLISAAVVIPLSIFNSRKFETGKFPIISVAIHLILLTLIPITLNIMNVYDYKLMNFNTELPAKYESFGRKLYPFIFPAENQLRFNHEFDMHVRVDSAGVWVPATWGFLEPVPFGDEPVKTMSDELNRIHRSHEEMLKIGLIARFPDKNSFLLEIEKVLVKEELSELVSGINTMKVDTVELRIKGESYQFLSTQAACDSVFALIKATL